MPDTNLVISTGNLKKDMLTGMVVLLTGGGGGIGFEAARSLLWLGAKVAIAEIDKDKGTSAIQKLSTEFGSGKAFFYQTDVSDEKSVVGLCRKIEKELGYVDVLLNNATVAPIGAAHTVGIDKWDWSYGVNLRGPVLLLEQILPGMLQRKSGAVIFVPSSGAAPYMGAYEVFKTSQVELCNTLAGELDGTGVFAFSIGPGIVKTDTANRAIEQIAPLYGKSVQEFYAMNEAVLISPEEAGAGFAAAVALADRYNGTETSSLQALADAGISTGGGGVAAVSTSFSQESVEGLRAAFAPVMETYRQQSEGWKSRNVFERQWVVRDFKKETGLSVDLAMEELHRYEAALAKNELPAKDFSDLVLGNIRGYYVHQKKMMMAYEKDRAKADTNAAIIDGWVNEIDEFERVYKEI
jgi:NAD(P)-dependent dehydrogenase (short-subunit alcohol dehydrogenase family)